MPLGALQARAARYERSGGGRREQREAGAEASCSPGFVSEALEIARLFSASMQCSRISMPRDATKKPISAPLNILLQVGAAFSKARGGLARPGTFPGPLVPFSKPRHFNCSTRPEREIRETAANVQAADQHAAKHEEGIDPSVA